MTVRIKVSLSAPSRHCPGDKTCPPGGGPPLSRAAGMACRPPPHCVIRLSIATKGPSPTS